MAVTRPDAPPCPADRASLLAQLRADPTFDLAVIGGGSTPDQSLPTYLIALAGPAHKLERKLRAAGIIARVDAGRLLLDLRTVLPSQEAAILAAL